MRIEHEHTHLTDTTKGLFDTRYVAIIPQIANISEYELEEYGYLDSPGIDAAAHLERTTIRRYMTVNDMMEVRAKGYPVSVPTIEEAVKIYQAISDHLKAWAFHLEHSINTKSPPTEDLLELDELATELFDRFKGFVIKNHTGSAGFRSPLEAAGLSRTLQKFRPTPKIDLDSYERVSHSGTFINSLSVNDIDLDILDE